MQAQALRKLYVWTVTREQTMEVEAETEDEAIEIAEDACEGDWDESDVWCRRGSELPPAKTRVDFGPESMRDALSKIPKYLESAPRYSRVGDALFITDGASLFRCPDGHKSTDGEVLGPPPHSMLDAPIRVTSVTSAPDEFEDIETADVDGKVFVNRVYLNAIDELFPSAVLYRNGALNPVQARIGDRLVAVVMPLAGSRR